MIASIVACSVVASFIQREMQMAREANTNVLRQLWLGLLDVPSAIWDVFGPSPAPRGGFQISDDHTVPDSLQCTITDVLMVEPAVLNGRFYERASIEQWVREHGTDPFSRLAVTLKDVRCHADMRRLTHSYAAELGFPLHAPE